MFEHSVKVPRHYKIAANIYKKVASDGGSVKTLLYDDKLRHFRTNVLYALITETIKHAADIDKIFEHCNLLKNEPRLDPWLAKVLTAELVFGKKSLPGKSKPEQTILSYQEQFEKYTSNHQDDFKTEAVRRPRYVRINTNLLTTSDAIGAFQNEGYHFVRCTSGSYNDYLKQIQELTEYDFTQDYHVKTMFVFSPGTKLHDHELYLENKIILQDKATAMAVHLLAPPPGSVVLDMCAAPGMKTTQLAAYMRNEGKIYAVERNEKRYQTLCDFVEKTSSKCVQTIHKDALEIKRGDYDDVEYILLDPSCSGSGMEFSVHNYIEETRLAKLTSLQEKFLKHAMNSFPKAKKIVYSTCSVFPEENERVITNVVKTSRAKWRVQEVKELLKGQWNNFGSGMYGSIGARCMYARPESDFTTGFFLAVLERDPDKNKNKEPQFEKNDEVKIKGHDQHKSKSEPEQETNEVITIQDCTNQSGQTKKKKKRKTHLNEPEECNEIEESVNGNLRYKVSNHENEVVESNTEVNVVRKKKKKKDKNKEFTESNATDPIKHMSVISLQNTKPSKKKKRKLSTENDTNDINSNVEMQSIDNSEGIPKKKKKKSLENLEIDLKIENTENLIEEVPKKKKKKKRDKDVINVE